MTFEYTIHCEGDGYTWGFLKEYQFPEELWYHTMFCEGKIVVRKFEGDWPDSFMKPISVEIVRE